MSDYIFREPSTFFSNMNYTNQNKVMKYIYISSSNSSIKVLGGDFYHRFAQ